MYDMRSAGVTGLGAARQAQRREVTPAPAELQTGSNQNNTESADEEVTAPTAPSLHTVDTMTVVPQTYQQNFAYSISQIWNRKN